MSLSQKLSQQSSRYTPNFVLITAHTLTSRRVFGDIIPMYSLGQELNSHIDDTKVKTPHLFSLVILYIQGFVQLFLNTFIYNIFVRFCSIFLAILAIPIEFLNLRDKTKHFYHIITSDKGRSFLLLEAKLSLQFGIKKIYLTLDSLWFFVRKMYLGVIVFSCLGCLYILPTLSTQSSSSSSFLQRFVQNNTVVTVANTKTTSQAEHFDTNKINLTAPKIQKITLHQVQTNETRASIADLYGLNLATVVYNNNLQNELTVGQKLYLPWVDGYIYSNQEDITPEKIEEMYSINKQIILDENSGSYDSSQNLFHKDTLILIPTTDFDKVSQVNDKIATQKKLKQEEDEKNRQMEEEKARNLSIASQAIPTLKTNTSNVKSESQMIWPTTGSISRCYSSYHRGCDIANFSAPPIVAAKSGVIVQVSRYQVVGYGLMVKIDHGNGEETLYAHMQNIYVQEGQTVAQGQAIGQMGSTGYSTGTHLHFEVRENGVQLDPLLYLP